MTASILRSMALSFSKSVTPITCVPLNIMCS